MRIIGNDLPDFHNGPSVTAVVTVHGAGGTSSGDRRGGGTPSELWQWRKSRELDSAGGEPGVGCARVSP